MSVLGKHMHNAPAFFGKSPEKKAQRKALITTLGKLKKKRSEIASLRQEVDAADYNVRDKKIRAEGIQMRYFAWTLAGVTLASMAIKMLNK